MERIHSFVENFLPKFALEPYAIMLQAVIFAILKCPSKNFKRMYKWKPKHILSASRVALKALNNLKMEKLKELVQNNTVVLFWIRMG